METVFETVIKGYDIEISIDSEAETYVADIKYPCGALAEGWECETLSEAEKQINEWMKSAQRALHVGCADEYCIGEK